MSDYDDAVMADSPPIDDVQLAALALQSLRTSTSPAASPPPEDIVPPQPASSFLSRVHSSAVRVYNSSKSYSPRFRYSAEKIESVAGSIRRGAYYSTTSTITTTSPPSASVTTSHNSSPASTNASGTATPTPRHGAHHHHHHPHTHQRKGSGVGGISGGVKKRTRPVWQNMLVTATSLATLSDESRQRLRYFLHMLKLANTRLATTISKLQENIQREQANAMAQNIAANHVPQDQQPQDDSNSVTYLKQDLINTIKKIVTVISTFAGNSLPEPARSHVRSYVMRLPANWANSVNCTPQTVTPQESTTPSTATSSSSSSVPHSTTATTRTSSAVNIEDEMMKASSSSLENDREKEIEAGGRVLTLATETLDMLGNIISVVDETLERAETWCARIGYNNLDDEEKSTTSTATTSLPGSQSPDIPHQQPGQMDQVA